MRSEEWRHPTIAEVPDAAFRKRSFRQVKQQERLHRSVHDEIGIIFLVAAILDVVVNPMSIERERGKSEQQHRVGDNTALPGRFLRRRHTPCLPGGSGFVAEHEVANLNDGVLVVLGDTVFRRDKAQVSGPPLLPLHPGDGDRLTSRSAKNQIALEGERAAGPHPAGKPRVRNELARGRAPVSANEGCWWAVEKIEQGPAAGEPGAAREIGVIPVEGGGKVTGGCHAQHVHRFPGLSDGIGGCGHRAFSLVKPLLLPHVAARNHPPDESDVTDFFDPTDPAQLSAFLSIIVIDIVMSGDNAIVIGMAVAGIPPAMRRRAIVVGIAAATILRICFALIVVELLSIVGLLLVGGLLLAWVCWRMWRDIRSGQLTRHPGPMPKMHAADKDRKPTTIRHALILIVVADVSMSLDNVLAVGGAAHGYHALLVFGLVLSIALMAVAANFIARLLHRHHWIAYIGLAVLLWVTGDMIWRGSVQVLDHL